MAESALINSPNRSRIAPILASVAGFIVLLFFAMWLRIVPLEPDPVLQGYLQITTGLLASTGIWGMFLGALIWTFLIDPEKSVVGTAAQS